MIIKFNLFENSEPKFKVGDVVYIIKSTSDNTVYPGTSKVTKVVKTQEEGNYRYKLDNYPNVDVREDILKLDYEIDAKKYNI